MSYPPHPGHHAPPGYPPYHPPPPKKSYAALWVLLVLLIGGVVLFVVLAFVAPGFLLSKSKSGSGARQTAKTYNPAGADAVANTIKVAFEHADSAEAIAVLCSDDDEDSKDDIREITSMPKLIVSPGSARHSPELFKMVRTMTIRPSGSTSSSGRVDVVVTVTGADGTYCADSVRLPG